MSETAAEVTAEYVKQIMKAATDLGPHEAQYLVGELLKEFGAKAYRQGREHLVYTMQKLV